jgi:UV DNA damage endonuclease
MQKAKKQGSKPGLRLGLCCKFRDQQIKFRDTTVRAMSRLDRDAALARLSELCLSNAQALQEAIDWCADHGIGCFRAMSQILPLKTHPEQGYDVRELPQGEAIVAAFEACGERAKRRNVRTLFHPDQFVVLNSPREEVVAASLAELEYQAEVAEWIGADVLIVHGGGAFGDKTAALERFAKNLGRLSDRARSRLVVENDDVIYAPTDLLPLCRAERLPLVYDVHHHRCLPDGLSVEEATELAIATWNREPLFHISSPLDGWDGDRPRRHHDFIDAADFPACWLDRRLTVEVEAKAKEVAVLELLSNLRERTRPAA